MTAAQQVPFHALSKKPSGVATTAALPTPRATPGKSPTILLPNWVRMGSFCEMGCKGDLKKFKQKI